MSAKLTAVSPRYAQWVATGSPLKVSALRIFEEVISGGDLVAADALIAPDFTDHFAAQRGAPPGIDSFKFGLQMIREAFPDWRSEVWDLVEEGDRVALRWRVSGTHNGAPFMGVPPSGKAIQMDEAGMMRFADGKLVELWRVADELALMRQLGMIPS
jgi:predicted ester cyclase